MLTNELQNKLDDAPESVFCVDLKLRQVFNQVVEVMGGQFVDDALDLLQDILSLHLLLCYLAATLRHY